MATKKKNGRLERREFLKKVAAGGALASSGQGTRRSEIAATAGEEPRGSARKAAAEEKPASGSASAASRVSFPRVFTVRNLKMIAFPLGGIGTGTISLGGRGQLCDWEIFNRPDKGNSPDYCFPAIWVESPSHAGPLSPTGKKGELTEKQAVARVLEARIEPPYAGRSGLGANNVPGLPRLASAKFIGAYPFARVEFQDKKLPILVSLEAFNPLVPLDVEASGLPIAVLRYHLKNPAKAPLKVGVAFSLQNPVGKEGRQANFRRAEGVAGLFMDNPFLPSADPLKGSMFLGVLGAPESSVSYLRGWKRTQWWDGPLTFWDDFTDDGALTNDSRAVSPVGSIAVTQSVPAGGEAAVNLSARLAFPQPHAGALRLGRPGRS